MSTPHFFPIVIPAYRFVRVGLVLLALTILVLVGSAGAVAQSPGSADNLSVRDHLPGERLSPEMSRDSNAGERPDIPSMALRICSSLILVIDMSNTGAVTPQRVLENEILRVIGRETAVGEERRQLVTEFWNEYHEEMICTEGVGLYPAPRHLLKRILDMEGARYAFYFDYIRSNPQMNINAVEWVDGTPETLLDYLDSLLAHPQAENIYNVHEFENLRLILVRLLGAKTAQDVLSQPN